MYHPPNADHKELKNHLCSGIDKILTTHPLSAIFLIRDFNQFPDKSITLHYQLKQLVTQATRKDNILDKCYTNIATFYQIPEILPHMGKSDHNSVLIQPQELIQYDTGHISKKTVRIQGQNEKALFVYELKQINWLPLYHLNSCEEKFICFDKTMTDLIEKYFPRKMISYHTKDKPWVTQEYKDLIKQRQKALQKQRLKIQLPP